jgi:hypothetical protein
MEAMPNSSSNYPHFDKQTLTSKGPNYPHPAIITIDSFEEYCTVTNKIVKSWRSHAVKRQKKKSKNDNQACERYVGEILPWFRGQTNANHSLTPSVARLLDNFSELYNNITTVEQYFQERFIRFARPYLTGIQPQDIVEWNYIMRHHAVPSRLLDWTKGSLIGLSYAVHDVIEQKYRQKYRMPNKDLSVQDQDCAVWMLEPRRLMEMATAKVLSPGSRNIASQDPKIKALRKLYFNDYRSELDNGWLINIDGLEERLEDVVGIRDYPMPLIPSHISRRLESHLSRFTLHSLVSSDSTVNADLPSKDTSLIKFAEDSFNQDDHWYLIKFIIPASKREEIARSLRMTGVSDMNFSQDLDGLSKELEFRFLLGAKDDEIQSDFSS